MARVAVLSHVVRDRIFRGGEFVVDQVGGAGAYAAVGAALVADGDGPIIVAGTGTADLEFVRAWMVDRHIDPSGLFLVGERGPITEVRYASESSRVETPVYGLEHFEAHTPLPCHIPRAHSQCDGVYLFHNTEAQYWRDIAEFRANFPGVILWEVAADCCTPDRIREVHARAALVDVVILNLSELASLYAVAPQEESLGLAADLAPLVLVHSGTQGSWVLAGQSCTWVGIRAVEAVDTTGGGNSYAGAFLQAYVDGHPPVEATKMAASAAGEVVSVFGAPLVTVETRRRVSRCADLVASASK